MDFSQKLMLMLNLRRIWKKILYYCRVQSEPLFLTVDKPNLDEHSVYVYNLRIYNEIKISQTLG